MHLQLDKILYSFTLLFASAVLWYFRRFIWPYRRIPSILFDRKIFIDFLRGKYPIVKYAETHSLNMMICACKIFENEGLMFSWFLEPQILVFNEEYAKILLNGSAALDKPWPYKVLSHAIGDGLLTHNGIIWKKRRKMINPAFKFERLKDYVSTFNRGARQAVDRLSTLADQPTYEVLHIMKTAFIKAICEVVFGTELNGDENERKIGEYGDVIARLAAYTVYGGVRPWTWFKELQFLFREGRKHQKDFEDSHNFTKHLIEKAMKDKTSDTVDPRNDEFERRSLFHLLLRHHLDDPKSFTMQNLRQEIQNIIFGGHDTTAHTMHWCLIMLSLHPEIQQKAFEEVESVLGSGDRDITYEDLTKLKYLDSIIKETLRLHPSVPYFSRVLTDDVQCGKYKIPKSTAIIFVAHMLHHNPDVYPNPDDFDPDRFYDKTLKHPWAFIPFAEGIRGCIGKNFAMLEMKVYLAHILRNFKLSLEDKGKEIGAKWCVVLEAASPVSFLLTKR